jgi:hypothetical protein
MVSIATALSRLLLTSSAYIIIIISRIDGVAHGVYRMNPLRVQLAWSGVIAPKKKGRPENAVGPKD